MKKIALCLYGNFNNRYNPRKSGEDGVAYIKSNIIRDKNIDVFIHSWDLDNCNNIISGYRKFIKKAVFEKQKDFSKEIEENGIIENIFLPAGGQLFRTVGNSLSFFYSRAKSIELKRGYEKEFGFIYDVVVVCRFDLGQIDKYNGWQPYKVSQIDFDENYDMRYI